MKLSALYASVAIAVLAMTVNGVQMQGGKIAARQEEGNAGGYLSYVSDMDSAESIRQAMETISWASKGSSWLVVGASATPEAAEPTSPQAAQATPQVGDIASQASNVVANTPSQGANSPSVANTSNTEAHKSSSHSLAIGLGVGIPLGVLALFSIIGTLIYKKRKAYKKDFMKRTSGLRQMSEAEV